MTILGWGRFRRIELNLERENSGLESNPEKDQSITEILL